MSISQSDASLAAVPAVDQFDPSSGASGGYDTPLGITNPPIDELLDRVSSKYALVIYAAKRARQINDYYLLGDPFMVHHLRPALLLALGVLEQIGVDLAQRDGQRLLLQPRLNQRTDIFEDALAKLVVVVVDLLEHTEGE